MAEFQRLVGHIRSAYSAIAAKIDELILVLNETEAADPDTTALAERIRGFLKNLEEGVRIAERSAQRDGAEHKMIALLVQELKDIKRLELYVALAARKPTPGLITQIHELSHLVSREMEAVRRAA